MHNSFEYHRSFACIDLTAIKENFDALKSLVTPETKVMAVMKADAYGHGAVRVAKTLESKADYFAVADIEEALELRENGIENPVLILSYTSLYQYEILINNNLIPTIYSLEDASRLSAVAVKLGKKCVVHIAVDTGMNRVGFVDSPESADIIEKISCLPNIEVEGIFTHFACADSKDKTSALTQKERFDTFIRLLESKGVDIPLKHCCNSAATIDFDSHYNMVRIGISLYGLYPSDEVMEERVALKPAMEVISHIIHIKDVEAGVGIGYGHTYVTSEKRKIATVCIGYADGFSRAFSNKGYVLIRGKKAPVIGRVCMDQIMVDITDIDGVNVGDYVVIMGENGSETITAEQLGEMCGSFNYEIICTFMPRVVRMYYENGEIV
ncbi:MAG: alanine racemase [Ruminococcaceae bacterium]|nr:alanine racemase [Oscillospiraceae bacterium]